MGSPAIQFRATTPGTSVDAFRHLSRGGGPVSPPASSQQLGSLQLGVGGSTPNASPAMQFRTVTLASPAQAFRHLRPGTLSSSQPSLPQQLVGSGANSLTLRPGTSQPSLPKQLVGSGANAAFTPRSALPVQRILTPRSVPAVTA